jgi:pSer/pThr/pTyr-binding forkhead associated (FHA) protein
MYKRKIIAAVCLFLLICVTASTFAILLSTHGKAPWRDYALWATGAVMAAYLVYEARTLVRFTRAAKKSTAMNSKTDGAVTALILLNEKKVGIKTWDLRNQTGLIIGRSHDEADVDIDLTDTEYFSLISDYHAVLNYTGQGWFLSDAGSKNGTAITRAGSNQKLLLVPGEPVPLRQGDTIYIAEETAISVN